MKITWLNFFYFLPDESLFYFRIFQFMTRIFPEKTQQGNRTFWKKVQQCSRTFLKLSGKVIGLFKNCSPRFEDFPEIKSG